MDGFARNAKGVIRCGFANVLIVSPRLKNQNIHNGQRGIFASLAVLAGVRYVARE